MQIVRNPGDIAPKDLSATAWVFAAGVSLFAFGFVLEWSGYPVEGGISGALALFFVAAAVLGQLLIWALGRLD